MASLILLFSDLLWMQEWDATALLATYPPSSLSSSSTPAAQRKTLKDEETVIENNPLEFESRVCVDFVWP
ncbi:unnamed protein product [Lathyrus oleraceus]